MRIPSTLWIAVALILPPMLIPVIEQFAPSTAYWWSALLVVLLNATALIVKVMWPETASKVSTPLPNQSTPFSSRSSGDKKIPEPNHSTVAKLFIYGA